MLLCHYFFVTDIAHFTGLFLSLNNYMRMKIKRLIFRRSCRSRVLCLLFVSATCFFYLSFRNSIQEMLDLDKCPACFGVSLCSSISQESKQEDLSLDVWGSLGTLANTIVTKNVFSGLYRNEKVIIKRLGSQKELQVLDQRICRAMGLHGTCGPEMKKVVNLVTNLRGKVKSLISGLPTPDEDHRLTLCPSTEHMDLLFKPIFQTVSEVYLLNISNNDLTANIWTTLQINPEPLLLQILRANDGWPVPHYLGSCGRMVMIENAGSPLLNYYSEPWPVRAGLALQLLLAADRFTYSHPHFAFYLLDISVDNIVVNEKGKLSFVDLEHVIVVDRHPPSTDMPKNWNDTHYSEAPEDCRGCYIFSAEDICSFHISDHNHFVICQQLLASSPGGSGIIMPNGLLHSTPHQISQYYPQIFRYLKKCSDIKSRDRIRSARQLRDALNIASKESPIFGETDLLKTWKYF